MVVGLCVSSENCSGDLGFHRNAAFRKRGGSSGVERGPCIRCRGVGSYGPTWTPTNRTVESLIGFPSVPVDLNELSFQNCTRSRIGRMRRRLRNLPWSLRQVAIVHLWDRRVFEPVSGRVTRILSNSIQDHNNPVQLLVLRVCSKLGCIYSPSEHQHDGILMASAVTLIRSGRSEVS